MLAICGPVSDEKSEADARLMAAAPDLLEIAELILEEWDKPTDGVSKGELIDRLSQYSNRARFVVKKAKGL